MFSLKCPDLKRWVLWNYLAVFPASLHLNLGSIHSAAKEQYSVMPTGTEDTVSVQVR